MSDFADRIAIRELNDRYLISVDSHDTAAFADNFWDDAVYESPFGVAEGRAAIIGAIEGWHAGGATAGKRHMAGPSIATIEGDRATGQASYWVVEAGTAPPAVVASGGYEDVYEKRDGTWRLARRVQTIDPAYQMGN